MKIPALNEYFEPALKIGRLYAISSQSSEYYSLYEMNDNNRITKHVPVNNGEIGTLLKITNCYYHDKFQFQFFIKNRLLTYVAYYGEKDSSADLFDARFEEIKT